MNNMKKKNYLIVIENQHLTEYDLDSKAVWEVGRPATGNQPDIRMTSGMVSRKHGRFQRIDGVWFYLDYNTKNGTVFNRSHMDAGFSGRKKPVMLKDGDMFLFGSKKETMERDKHSLGLFVEKNQDFSWKVIDTSDGETIKVKAGDKIITLRNSEAGTVIEEKDGMAIYMGNRTYVAGDIHLQV